MRIIKQFPHPICRISVLSMNEKYNVKFELGDYEQIYKYYIEDIGAVDQLEQHITPSFITNVLDVFAKMKANKSTTDSIL